VVLLADGSASAVPNPVTSGVESEASLRILDLQGRELEANVNATGETEWTVELQTIPSGLYILEAKFGGRTQFARFVCTH
jgi:hypothetical protein